MATCIKCGATIPDNSPFCNMCGAKQELTCPGCGAVLPEGSRFCNLCGTPLSGTAPVIPDAAPAVEQPKRRGRPPKAETTAPKKKASYPDVRGFYENPKGISVSDRAIVFSTSSGSTYRIDKDLNMKEFGSYDHVVQTADGILAISRERDSETNIYTLTLRTRTDDGKVLSSRTLYEMPGYGGSDEYIYTLTSEALYVIHFVSAEDDTSNPIAVDMQFIRIDLESGEETIYAPNEVRVENGRLLFLDSYRGRLLAHNNKLYFECDMAFPNEDPDDEDEEDRDDAMLVMDFATGEFTLLWRGGYDKYGKPRFFDFKNGIMWTVPREMEMKRRGWAKSHNNELRADMMPLVPRKIAPNAPILANYQVWEGFPISYSSHFSYFDGEKAYYAPDYYHFYAIDRGGNVSEDWTQSLHGRSEETVLWQNKIIADLQADYYYTAYPAQFDRPKWDECIDMRKKTIE